MIKREARARLDGLINNASVDLVDPPVLLKASDYFDLAGEEFGRRLLLTTGVDGVDYCLRPDFTLPIAQSFMAQSDHSARSFGYLGKVFRQRTEGPSEFTQAGLELLAHTDADRALDRVFDFAATALNIFDVSSPHVRLGSVGLFEAVLAQADMPDVWRPRLRHRFGHRMALFALLARLADPHAGNTAQDALSRDELVAQITERMIDDGLSLISGRLPAEIAERFIEKQALAAAHIPAQTLDLLTRFLQTSGPVDDTIDKLCTSLAAAGIDVSAQCAKVRNHANKLAENLEQSGVNASQMTFEAGFSPRLHYYTGLVFQILGQDGTALASGGQYDRLLQSLGATSPISAAGCALWVERMEAEARP